MKYLLILLLNLFTASLFSQSVTGTWQGDLHLPVGMKLPLVLHIQPADDSLTATMDSPVQGAKGIPVNSISFNKDQLIFKINALSVEYTGTLKGDSIAGNFVQSGQIFQMVLKRTADSLAAALFKRPQKPKPKYSYKIEDIEFTNSIEGNKIAGTLTTPWNVKQYPVVVMITGSGAQDRDETLFGHKPFWVIADYFARQGIGTLRMDDRGVGSSEAGKKGATSADFATDINSAVSFLTKKGFKNIGLVGHSEGGMIAPMVASENKNVQFMILLAGLGITGAKLNVQQIKSLNKVAGANDSMINRRAAETQAVVDVILKYAQPELSQELEKIYTRTFLSDSTKEITNEKKQFIGQQLKLTSSPWFIFFTKFDPDVYLSKIKIPVLALNGSLDAQVSAKENLEGIKKSLEKAGNKNFETKELPGLNHLFQEAKTGAISEYSEIEQTISPKVLQLMSTWILKVSKR